MNELVPSRRRYTLLQKGVQAPTFLRALGIEFHQIEGKDFWQANKEILQELYELTVEEVRERMHELHPDKGGDTEGFAKFISDWTRIKRQFRRAMPVQLNEPPPSTVKFTPIERIRLDRKAAQARERRRKNRKKFREQRRARYARLKAEGRLPKQTPETARRYRERHRRKLNKRRALYRKEHPEKVREWKKKYYDKAKAEGRLKPRTHKEYNRIIPGTPQYERRLAWRREYLAKNREKLNEARRVKDKQPRIRDHKGVFLPHPMKEAA